MSASCFGYNVRNTKPSLILQTSSAVVVPPSWKQQTLTLDHLPPQSIIENRQLVIDIFWEKNSWGYTRQVCACCLPAQNSVTFSRYRLNRVHCIRSPSSYNMKIYASWLSLILRRWSMMPAVEDTQKWQIIKS